MLKTEEEIDREYAQMEQEEKNVEKLKKQFHYKIQKNIECCLSCKKSGMMPEDDLRCVLMEQPNYSVNSVAFFGKCDNYDKMKY